jgi:probable 2-oxoglutarate dehydrogenase E1 component DHKTD1
MKLSSILKQKYKLKSSLINSFGLSKLAKANFSFHTRVLRESNLKGYISNVRKNGHKFATVDPLGISNSKATPDLMSDHWGIAHLEKLESFPLDESHNFNETMLGKNTTIYELENYLNKMYLGKIGVEFDHIECDEEKAWLYENYEKLIESETSNIELINAFKLLYPADLFEKFLHSKFPTFKRYSGEGANTLLVLLYSILAECSKKINNTSSAIISMPHRGRLNILPLLLDYPVSHLISKIQGKRDFPKEIEGIDDVVSHVAVSNEKIFCLDGDLRSHKPINISILHNPSHLEAINPVGQGKAFAKIQDNGGDSNTVLNITIHGDSAVSGQGVIYETLSFHKSPNCNMGGTLHIVTNNQIGYTTQCENSRSSRYCTDIFKSYHIPVVHVNSDDIDGVVKLGKLAHLYKQKFKKDFMIDLVCWRKYGHNEVDEPMFTQPSMYKIIKSKKETVESFKDKLLEKNIITKETIISLEDKYNKILNDEFQKANTHVLKIEDVRNEKFKGNKSLTHKWKSMNFPQFCEKDENILTGFKSTDELVSILKSSINLPATFNVHPRIKQYFINSRLGLLEKGMIDWPGAEMAAFGALLKEGFNIRLSGQDVTRGTFSQRHIGFTDQDGNSVYYPLADNNNFSDLKGRLEVNNSSLSEFGVMLFEYGYSLESPKNFVIWEAQFGDFNNGAQVITLFIFR